MLSALANFGFDLSNREIAALIYIGILLTAVLMWEKGRPLTFDVLRAFLMPNLALLWLYMSLYVTACVCLLAWLNLWDWPNLKSTLLWWFTVGFTCIFEAQRLKDKPNMLRKMARKIFTVSAIVLFITQLISFPLLVELLMLPPLLLLTFFIAFGENQAEKRGIPQLLQLLRGLQIFLALIMFSFSCWMVANIFTDFWSLHTLREFGLPLLLCLMFIPFIFLLAVYMSYEDAFNYSRRIPERATILRYARWRALLAFGWNIERVKRLARDIRGREIAYKQSVKKAIREIQQLVRIEKDPPAVPRTEGWSPHVARLFLEEYGLATDDYHRTGWNWSAQISSVKLNNKVLSDQISYYLNGNESAVTRLQLELNGSNQNDTGEAQRTFDKRALTLLAKAFGAEQALTIYAHTKSCEPAAVVLDGVRVSLERADLENSTLGNYARNLTIQHPKHQEDS